MMTKDLTAMRTPGFCCLAALLATSIVVPALAISWGTLNGRLAYILYREPKLIALTVLGWSLVSAFLWCHWRQLCSLEVWKTFSRPPVLLLALFVGYLMTTGLWVRVKENFAYELNQYLLLLPLLLMLLIWVDRDPLVADLVRNSLIAGAALITIAGLIQWFVPIPLLRPIDPQIGAPHPSVMGYKNPAALAVLGQIFLLTQCALGVRHRWV